MAASACSFFSVPVLLEKIGVDDYAVWVTLTSLIGWLSLFDFGAGYSLRNRIAESKALNETTALETVMKGNFTFFCINALFALVVFGGSLCFVDIFKNYTLLAVLLYVPLIVSFPTFLGPFIYQGLGRIPEMNFLQFLPQFLWLVFIFAFRGLTNDKLLVLCIGFTSIQLVLRLILFVRAMRYLNMPFKGMFSMGCLKETADVLKENLNLTTSEHLSPRGIQNITEEILKNNDLDVAGQTLNSLENEIAKHRFLESISREIQFEYSSDPSMLTLSECGAEKLGLTETISDPKNDESLKAVISEKCLGELAEAVRKTTFEQPVTEYECDMTFGGETKRCKVVCLSIWSDDDHSRRDGIVGKVFEA